MQAVDFTQFLLQIVLAFAFCTLFRLAGSFLCAYLNITSGLGNTYQKAFYSLFSGMICSVAVYATALSGFKTVYILVLLAGITCLKRNVPFRLPDISTKKLKDWKLAEMLLLVTSFVLLFNFLPESEYKQKDSFFYLKISEALNLAGQENTSNYYNLYSDRFHGVEAYHYFECWLSALLLKLTQNLIPGIQIFRIVTYSIISVTFVYGLFYLWELIAKKRPRFLEKVTCFSFIFFFPDVLSYAPGFVRHYIVFNYENNFLERPNLRLIYLFLLPVIGTLLERSLNKRLVFFLVCLITVNPTVFVVAVPAILLISLTGYSLFKQRDLFFFLFFVALYAAFYYLFSVKEIPPMYASGLQEGMSYFKRSFKFVGLTITTSLLYIAVIIAVSYVLLKLFTLRRNNLFFQENRVLFYFLGLFIITGVVIARVFGFMENLYQVAFNSYITASILVFIFLVLIAKESRKNAVLVMVLSIFGYVLLKLSNVEKATQSVFAQNGSYSYRGMPYSQSYLAAVTDFAKKESNCEGAYIADSAYYQNLYYSARNPNVYHLPITYIMANYTAANNDYCLSSPSAIKYDWEKKLANNRYLNNAIARSYYHVISGSDHRGEFLKNHQLKFLILTPGIQIDSIKGLRVKNMIVDPNTKERFLILEH